MSTITQRLQRLCKHRWTEGKVRHNFSAETLQHLERLVAASEQLHTGQIRLCIEGGLPYSYIWRSASPRERALGLFGKLRTWDTEHNNGVLIYLLMADHAIEIVADRALARHVSPAQWNALIAPMQTAFQLGDFVPGLEQTLQAVTGLLVQHFPRHREDKSAQHISELPDAPVVQRRFFKDQ